MIRSAVIFGLVVYSVALTLVLANIDTPPPSICQTEVHVNRVGDGWVRTTITTCHGWAP